MSKFLSNSYYLNRTICDVLDETRVSLKLLENTQYGNTILHLQCLNEEAQSMANRMEAALGDVRDVNELIKDLPNLRNEYKVLRNLINGLKKGED